VTANDLEQTFIFNTFVETAGQVMHNFLS